MKNFFIALGLSLGIIVIPTSSVVLAEENTCIAPLDGGPDTIGVSTYDEMEDWSVPGTGYVVNTGAACLPNSCPTGYFLGSGGCMSEDPFEGIPYGDDTPHVGSPPIGTPHEPISFGIYGPATVNMPAVSIDEGEENLYWEDAPMTIDGPTSGPYAQAERLTPPKVTVIGDSITFASTPKLECDVTVNAIPGRAHDGNILRDGDSALSAITSYQYTSDRWIIAIGTNDVASLTSLEDAMNRIELMIDATGADRHDITFVMVHHGDYLFNSFVWNSALYMTEGINVARWAPEDSILFDGVHPTDEGEHLFADTICGAA